MVKNSELEVLIVDDDPISVFLHKFMLKQSGFIEPMTVLNALDALKFIQNSDSHATEKSYLILLDINMPGMNAWEFLYMLDEFDLAGRFQVVIVTSSINFKDQQIAKSFKNIVDYIEKPLREVDCEKLKKISSLEKYFN